MNAFACKRFVRNDFSTYSLLLNMNREKKPSKNVIMLWTVDG
jgi:hypothetical protein